MQRIQAKIYKTKNCEKSIPKEIKDLILTEVKARLEDSVTLSDPPPIDAREYLTPYESDHAYIQCIWDGIKWQTHYLRYDPKVEKLQDQGGEGNNPIEYTQARISDHHLWTYLPTLEELKEYEKGDYFLNRVWEIYHKDGVTPQHSSQRFKFFVSLHKEKLPKIFEESNKFNKDWTKYDDGKKDLIYSTLDMGYAKKFDLRDLYFTKIEHGLVAVGYVSQNKASAAKGFKPNAQNLTGIGLIFFGKEYAPPPPPKPVEIRVEPAIRGMVEID